MIKQSLFRLLLGCLFFSTYGFIYGQNVSEADSNLKFNIYSQVFDSLKTIIENDGSFSRSVFLVENAYHNYNLPYSDFQKAINDLSKFITQGTFISRGYNYSDILNYIKNYSIFSKLFDTTLHVKNNSLEKDGHIAHYSYSHIDPMGKKEWSNMFVINLLATRKGNCHSLAYLYKIIADKVDAKCWFALVPNHIYIRCYSQKVGWYNIELTSGTFPTDAWIATSTYVSMDAIRSGIYMDTLSNQQSISLCVLDLAKGYEFQTHNYYDGFILKCCDMALKYHPINPMALLLKAETLKKVYFKEVENKKPDSTITYLEMENAYITLAKLHYRELPEKAYLMWLNSLRKQNNKYPSKQSSN
ncbi:hypothetical protein A4H97_10965 [Niastella yeongjuensis]|uniref:Protein SirB1 N-terminal domain-containing protein n=1 Tax=Niastella yeongjuensis TaxID=354355 RepID=A0A1V9EFH2_9BACT|nr:hypothetical protein [Niastella yeongjuensis]OQP44870.1 hypothetical protein A4H97_10965 [Niastella yeongjuensis]SEP41749.1 hypothetical protein SAMN05660816_05905 [Niastella yeongjuensis]